MGFGSQKIRDFHSFSQTRPFPALSDKGHTPKAPVVTQSCRMQAPLTFGHPQFFLSWGGHLRTQLGLWERTSTSLYSSKNLRSNVPGLLYWGDSLPPSPSPGYRNYSFPGSEAVPKSQGWGGRWGKGEEEGAAPPSETQRDVLQPRLHGDAEEGERALWTSFPTCGTLGTSVPLTCRPSLGPTHLGWGRGDAAAGGLGAVSIFVCPAREGLRAPPPP